MKRILGVFVACILLLGLAGIAHAGDVGYYLIDSVSDGEVSMSREELLALGLDWSILLEEGGGAQVRFDELVLGTWADGVIAATVDGETEAVPYTIEGDALIIDLGEEMATFRRGDGATPAAAAIPQEETEEPVPEALTPLQQWWAGDWYGYWAISGVTDRYDALDDGCWDCYAQVALAEDGAGSIAVWDDEGALFTVDIAVSEAGGSGVMGAAISEGGSYRDGAAIGRADMIIDPSLYGYDDYMVIDSYYESADDPDEGYYFWMYLRPWGRLWDDIPAEDRPPQYADWYLAMHSLSFGEALGIGGVAAVGLAGPAPEAAQAPGPASTLAANCPDGWLAFAPHLLADDVEEIPPALEFRKGATTEDDRFDCPGMTIYYDEDRGALTMPTQLVFGDVVEIAPMEIGGRTWHGVTGTWLWEEVAELHTQDNTNKPITILLRLSMSGASISLEDADVLEIIGSIRP